MRRLLLGLVCLLWAGFSAQAQDLEVLCDLDAESDCISWDFNSAADFAVVPNPKVDDVNPGTNVLKFATNPEDAFPLFVHEFEAGVDFEAWPVYKMLVYTEATDAELLLKFEKIDDFTIAQEQKVTVTPGVWQEYIFEFVKDANITDPLPKMVIFPDFGTKNRAHDWYFDNIIRTKEVTTSNESVLAAGSELVDGPNFPNPFNQSTTIRYRLDAPGSVKVSVFNVLGQEVGVLVDGLRSAGSHEATLNASGLDSGIYVYRIEFGGRTASRTMVLTK